MFPGGTISGSCRPVCGDRYDSGMQRDAGMIRSVFGPSREFWCMGLENHMFALIPFSLSFPIPKPNYFFYMEHMPLFLVELFLLFGRLAAIFNLANYRHFPTKIFYPFRAF